MEMEKTQQRPHLLAIPFPAQGHINPMLELCKRLASSGVLVTFLVPFKRGEFMVTEPRVSGQYFKFLYLRHCFVQAASRATLPLQVLEETEVAEIIRDSLEDVSLPSVSGILTDVMLVGLQGIAREFGILKVSLSTFSASWHSFQNRADLLEQGEGSSRSVRQAWNEALKDEDWVFINSFQELEPSEFKEFVETRPRFLPIGPLLPSFAFDLFDGSNEQGFGFWEEDLSCLKWLDEQPAKSVLYVSFGSLASVSADEIRELFTGLFRSGHPFLWVVRSNSARSSDVMEILLEGDGTFGKRCKIVRWAPQLKVLKHPSVAAFLTHCGWNSLLEAVVAGVPILGWPILNEQPFNCELAMEVWKAGRRLPARVEWGAFAEAVEDVMGAAGERWRENVLKLSMAAKDASESNLSSFLNQCFSF